MAEMIDLSKIHYTVRAELVEALLPFDKLRANGFGLSRIMKKSRVAALVTIATW
jgi:hypothetical protein